MMIKNMEIKTIAPPNLLPKKQRAEKYSDYLYRLTVDMLKKYYPVFLDAKTMCKKKDEIIPGLTAAMVFDDEKTFRRWFFG
ncbi:MAG: hypothetical protein LBS57_02225, partial [Treponema sp.]|nr:hypothetical protein [Treponema sp.]